MRRFQHGLRAAAAFALLAAPAAASETGAAPQDLLGQWGFETEPYDINCVMTGGMTLAATADPAQFSCSLTTQEVCGPLRFRTRQSCVATLVGGRLVVISQLESVEPDPEAYAPDNFVLDQVSGFEMTGQLRSADIAPVRFFRATEATS